MNKNRIYIKYLRKSDISLVAKQHWANIFMLVTSWPILVIFACKTTPSLLCFHFVNIPFILAINISLLIANITNVKPILLHYCCFIENFLNVKTIFNIFEYSSGNFMNIYHIGALLDSNINMIGLLQIYISLCWYIG